MVNTQNLLNNAPYGACLPVQTTHQRQHALVFCFRRAVSFGVFTSWLSCGSSPVPGFPGLPLIGLYEATESLPRNVYTRYQYFGLSL